MTAVVVTNERERLDRIAKAALGSERAGGLEALLDANPGLAAKGPFAVYGSRLNVPERVTAPQPAPATSSPWE